MHSTNRKQYSNYAKYKTNANRASAVEKSPSPPLGHLLETILHKSLVTDNQKESTSTTKTGITDVRFITSFSLTDNKRPTILVPGMPPKWTPVEKPYKLTQDGAMYYRDPNSARFPNHPLEPAVRSLFEEEEEEDTFDPQEIEIFGCSSTLGNLLRFLKEVDKPFRFFVQAVGNTVFLTRRENSATECIQGIYGYGHTFPESYTTWPADVKGSVSNQRLLNYNLAGLNCIVRYACDGYLPDKVSENSSPSDGLPQQEQDLGVALDGVNISSRVLSDVNGDMNLEMRHAGVKIPQEAVFELKTRAAWKKEKENVLEEELGRLWITQASYMIIAYHRSGVFHDIEIQDVGDDLARWEQANQHLIRCLHSLLSKIAESAKARPDKKLEVVRKNTEILEIREQDTSEYEVLPSKLKQQWMRGNASERDSSTEEGSDYRSASSELDSDADSEKDFTACSASSCGYCGHCSY